METEDSVSIFEWLNRDSSMYHMTIKDILDIDDGEEMDIFLMDRNVLDLVNVFEVAKPSFVFRNNYYIRFVKKNYLLGNWIWKWGENFGEVVEEREFELLIGDRWRPMENGYVKYEDNYLHWSCFNSEETKIGWRGYMMPLDKMDICPLIKPYSQYQPPRNQL